MNDSWWTPAKVWVVSILSLILLIGLGVGIPLAVTATNAATSATTGKLNEKIAVNSAQNMMQQYNLSYNEMATYKSDLEAVYSNWETLNTFDKEYSPADIAANQTGNLAQLQQEDQAAVTGAQQVCTQAAAQYNADGAKLQTGATYRGENLPKTVSLTACEKGSQN